MLCLRCRAEYVPGVVTCADCGVSLVDADPDEDNRRAAREPQAEWQFEALVSSGNPADVHSIISAFEAENIVYYVYDQNAAIQMGHGAYLSSVLVRSDQFQDAERILQDLELGSEGDGDRDARSADADSEGSGASSTELTCLDCDGWLVPQQRAEMLVFQCNLCTAMWLDAGAAASYERDLARQLPGARLPPFERASSAQPETCPGCETTSAERGMMGGIAVARCAACGGLFLSADSEAR